MATIAAGARAAANGLNQAVATFVRLMTRVLKTIDRTPQMNNKYTFDLASSFKPVLGVIVEYVVFAGYYFHTQFKIAKIKASFVRRIYTILKIFVHS